MRVCMVVWSFRPAREGGAERQCLRLARALAAQGVAVTILTAWLVPGSRWREQQGEVRIARAGLFAPLFTYGRRAADLFTRLLPPRFSSDALRSALGFWFALPFGWAARLSFMAAATVFFLRNRARIDVIHVHEASWIAGFAGWIGAILGLPVLCKEATFPVLPVIGYDVPLRRAWARRRAGLSFIAMNGAIADELGRQGIPTARIVRVSNGVVIPAGQADPGGGEEVLYVGNFSQGSAWKAFDVLIESWAAVIGCAPGAHLELVGGGDHSPWRRLAAEHGVLESMSFRGAVKDVGPCYRRAAVFVLPSRVEGMSNALLEAQSWGLACVVSDIPGNRAVVTDRENGLVVPVGDSAAFGAAVVELLKDRDLRRRLGAAARVNAVERFDMAGVAGRMISVYDQVVAGGMKE